MIKIKFFFASAIVVFFTLLLQADIIDTLLSPALMSKGAMPMHEFNFKLGFDFDGKFNINEYIDGVDEKRLNAGNNASFAVECIKYFNEYIGAGAGISAQIARVIDGLPGRVGFAPLYFSLKVRSWPQEPGLYGYVLGQMGYNFFYSDSGFEKRFSSKEGGFYYGVGLGFAYETFIFEGIYSVNSGSVKDRVDDNKINMEYGKITVSMGYKL